MRTEIFIQDAVNFYRCIIVSDSEMDQIINLVFTPFIPKICLSQYLCPIYRYISCIYRFVGCNYSFTCPIYRSVKD